MFDRAQTNMVMRGEGLDFGMRWVVQHSGEVGFDMIHGIVATPSQTQKLVGGGSVERRDRKNLKEKI